MPGSSSNILRVWPLQGTFFPQKTKMERRPKGKRIHARLDKRTSGKKKVSASREPKKPGRQRAELDPSLKKRGKEECQLGVDERKPRHYKGPANHLCSLGPFASKLQKTVAGIAISRP